MKFETAVCLILLLVTTTAFAESHDRQAEVDPSSDILCLKDTGGSETLLPPDPDGDSTQLGNPRALEQNQCSSFAPCQTDQECLDRCPVPNLDFYACFHNQCIYAY